MRNILLSICVCSVMGRRSNFLPKILDQLDQQTSNFKDVEILVLLDNKHKMLGDKRNDLVAISQGKYIVFVDDDDRLSDDYVSTLRDAILNNDVDVINFIVSVSLNKGPYKPCYYSMTYKDDYNMPESYHRLPNHICCIKRSLAINTPYKRLLRAEDFAYSHDLHPKLKSEYNIDKVLYYYDFNIDTTETQKQI